MVEDGGFRYEASIHKGLGFFHGCDADCAINIGDDAERELTRFHVNILRIFLFILLYYKLEVTSVEH